jgi:tetratricopeptide (TPR) repeat protein
LGIQSPASRRQYVLFICIFGAAILLRLIYLTHLRQLPFFDHPIMDASYHDTWAREIASGSLMRTEPFFRAPLYPYLLALVYRIWGGSYLVPRLLQFLLGGFTCVATLVLARRLIGQTAGIVAGIICIFYPVLIYFEGELLTETLFTFLTMVALLLLDTASRQGKSLPWFWAGLCLGLALITRPTIVLFVPLALIGCLLFSKRKTVASLLLAVGIGIPLAPVTFHNYAVSREFIPVVWQGGLNFYLGNNPAADGWSATSPEIRKDWWGGYSDMIAIPREALGREPKYDEVSAFWRRRGTEFIRSQPGGWTRLMLRKAALFWNAMEFPNNQDYNFAKLYSWVLRNPVVNFGVIAPLCLLGVFVLLPQFRRLYFVYAFLVAYFVVTVAFFVCSRYRAPALPVICLFAGGLVSYITRLLKTRRWAGFFLCVLGLAGAALFVNLNPTAADLPDLAQSYTQVGKVYVELGQDDAAIGYFKKAVVENPEWGDAYEQIGLISMKRDQMQDAERYLLKAIEVLPHQATAYRALAMLYLREGDLTRAKESVNTAIRLAPYLEDSHNVLGSIQWQEDDLNGAIVSYLTELELNPRNWRAHANLGGAYHETGDLESAAAAYEKAVELNPEDPNLVLALASVYSELGKDDLARRTIDRLGSGSPGDINLRYNQAVILQNAGNLEEARHVYEEILRDAPLHEGSLVNLGVIYARAGLDDRALELWQRALEVNPGNQTARRNIELLRDSAEEVNSQ